MKDIKKVKSMNVFCYARVPNRECLTKESQTELVRYAATRQGLTVINTSNSRLDTKLLSVLATKGVKLNEAVITFRE